MDSSFTMISQLKSTSPPCKIRVCLQRLWDVYRFGTTTPIGRDLILIDEKGAQIHASISSIDLITFEDQLEENGIYIIENFAVDRKDLSYCPLTNPYKIKFMTSTTVEVVNEVIPFPKPKFTFTAFAMMESKVNKTDPLTDVIGLYQNLDDIVKSVTNKGNYDKRELHIINTSGDKMKITFWGDCAMQLLSLEKMTDEKHVIVITSTVAKKFNNVVSLHSTFATKVYIDMIHLPGAVLLLDSDAKAHTKRMSEDNNTLLADVNIMLQKATQPFTIYSEATVVQVYDTQGFCYNACPNCPKAVKRKDTTYWCYKCQEFVEEPRIRLRLQFQTDDGTAQKDMTAFDIQAKYLLGGKSLDDMFALSYQGDGEALVKEVLNQIVGQKFDFEIKISDYGLDHPDSPFTATNIYESSYAEQSSDSVHKKQKVVSD